MKNIKFSLLATLLVFVLVAGQPHAVIASTNSGSSTGFRTSSYAANASRAFYVDITQVADNLQTMNATTSIGGARVYELVTSSPVPTVRVSVDISGYTVYTNSTGDNNLYGGQLFAIVNGQVLQGTLGAISSSVTINLGFSDNVITFFYVGREQDGTLKFASDTVIVRVAADAGDFTANPYTLFHVPIVMNSKNLGAGVTEVNATGVLATNLVSGYSLDPSVSPVNASQMSLTYLTGTGKNVHLPTGGAGLQNMYVSDKGEFSIGGSYNALGFIDNQNKGFDYNAGEMFGNSSVHDGAAVTEGHVFFTDVSGVHMINAKDRQTTTIASSNLADKSVGSPLGVFVLGDLGYWDIAQDAYGATGSDWYGVVSGDGMYGATNFAVGGVYAMLYAQTQTVNISTVTGSAPGFGVVITLFSVGVIAYVAPRMRKD